MLSPSRWRIVAIGKVRKPWIQEGFHLYQKRLPGLTLTELRDNGINKEAQSINRAISNNELLVTLGEEGELLTSLSFSRRLQKIGSNRVAFVIGGANGLSSEIKAKAFCNISLSRLTFPHDIARLLLIEQLYRATTIVQGGPYHRE